MRKKHKSHFPANYIASHSTHLVHAFQQSAHDFEIFKQCPTLARFKSTRFTLLGAIHR